MTVKIEEPEFFIALDKINANNIIDETKSVCEHCENIVKTKTEIIDISITRKLKINNVESIICKQCNHPVGFLEEAQKQIENEVLEFKKNRPTISKLLKTNSDDSYRWCNSEWCACMGAANCSGSLSDYLYTKTEWILWKDVNPLDVNKFLYFIESYDSRMKAIQAFKETFNLSTKESVELMKSKYKAFSVMFKSGTQNQKYDKAENLVIKLKEHGVNLHLEAQYSDELSETVLILN